MKKTIFTVSVLTIFTALAFVSVKVFAHGNPPPPQCKHLEAECEINNSDKTCCEGLVCVPFNHQSGNGKCYLAPTPTPTLKPTPTPKLKHHYVCREDQCVRVDGDGEDTCKKDKDCEEVIPTPTPTETPVTPTPTPEPTPTPAPETPFPQPQNGVTGDPTAPGCTDVAPYKAPDNFHVYRKGDDAVAVWFYDATIPWKVIVYYGLTGQGDQHSVIFDNKPGSGIIHFLGNRAFDFSGQFLNGCSGGPRTKAVVDGSTHGWTLFR